jgi:predicted MFS family arabinose efflux permease
VLISWLGATASVAADAVTFLVSAFSVSRIRRPEPLPPERHPTPRWRELTAGWHYLLGHRDLRALWLNAMVFGGCVMAGAPLLAVFTLRDLGFEPWQYGFVLGVPCVGGVLGALLVRPVRRRWGERSTLLGFGTLRALWLGALPLAPAGTAGVVVIAAGQFLLLVCSGAFNPTFATYRMHATEDSHMSRVLSAWSISSRVAQPLMIVVGGLIAAAVGPRAALAVMAVLVLASIPLLPWRSAPVRQPVEVSASPGSRPPGRPG